MNKDLIALAMGDERRALLPCPFCGSSDLDPAKQAKQYVACNKCGAFGPSPDSSYPLMQWDLRRAAIHDAWQARSALAAPQPSQGAQPVVDQEPASMSDNGSCGSQVSGKPVSAEAGKGVEDCFDRKKLMCRVLNHAIESGVISENEGIYLAVAPSESVAVSADPSAVPAQAVGEKESVEPWVDGNGVIRTGVLPDATQEAAEGGSQ